MTLDDSGGSWVPGDPTSGSDPASAGSIIDSDPVTERFLRQQIAVHSKAIDLIQSHLNKSAIPKARPNPNGPTEGTRRVVDSRGSGIQKGDFALDPSEHLEFLKKMREQTEAELQLPVSIIEEREKLWNAQREVAQLKLGKPTPKPVHQNTASAAQDTPQTLKESSRDKGYQDE